MTIGIDLGTSVIKGIVVDDNGVILAETAKENYLVNSKPNWSEQSPEEWWTTTIEIIRYLGTKVDLSQIKGIGLSGQMHGLVSLNAQNKPVRRGIVWLDQRSDAEVKELLYGIGREEIYEITGNPIFTGFLLPSLLWIKKNEPEHYAATAHVCSPKDYLSLELTGTLATEPTDALATSAFDYQKNTWSNTMLDFCGIDASIFPTVQPTHEPYGGITAEVARITGLPQGIPVYGASDQAMAAIGAGLVHNGDAMIALSTGGQYLVVADKGHLDTARRLHTLNHGLPEQGLYMAATLAAALSMKWFKENLIQNDRQGFAAFTKDAENVPLGSRGLVWHPYIAGERTPYFNADLRGAFTGVSVSHTQADFIRAIMEGVAFSIKQCNEVFDTMNLPRKRIVISGGGAKNPLWRQILTDVLGHETQTINIEDHSPFGAAVFAKFAPKNFEGIEAFYEQVIHPVDFMYPNNNLLQQYNELYKEYASLAEIFHSRARAKSQDTEK